MRSQTSRPHHASTSAPIVRVRRRLLLRELSNPRLVVSHISPNWFASVMGTGIVANAAATLPLIAPQLHAFASVVWVVATVLLLGLIAASAAHWVVHREVARSHHRHPVMVHFYGAPPLAILTIGAGALLFGPDIIGSDAALTVALVLWSIGTVLGLATAVIVPFLTFTSSSVTDQSAFGGWLMPVVPPLVSAAAGAPLIPFLPAGEARLTMLLACYAMFGLSMIATAVILPLIWGRLARHNIGNSAAVPTLWIVLGPLAQSITAAIVLGAVAPVAVSADLAEFLGFAGIIYGIPTLGFALLWTALAIAMTVHTARRGLPFSLTWWSFTFPVGNMVVALSVLAFATGSAVLEVMALLSFVALVGAWVLVAVRTFNGSVIHGTLFLAPPVTADAGKPTAPSAPAA
ncbi:TDT family transporter [Salinibacterium sp. M195]|uniref:TDT family transporter n=1 Tax=Salinibacterium sp. M195 TaxID=2583374 RepID=UPI001C629400|nr:TDT family transporter [Salinibacterium sp. M195]QYH35881.1 C4-dicarboxylate ABC transporter [Salinibacterium sp. M195]